MVYAVPGVVAKLCIIFPCTQHKIDVIIHSNSYFLVICMSMNMRMYVGTFIYSRIIVQMYVRMYVGPFINSIYSTYCDWADGMLPWAELQI